VLSEIKKGDYTDSDSKTNSRTSQLECEMSRDNYVVMMGSFMLSNLQIH